MSLISCPECAREISDRAPHCPNCGFPMQTSASAPVHQSARVVSLPHSQTREIAYRQKLLLYSILVLLLSQLPIMALLNTNFAALGWVGMAANFALEVWCLYKLGQALEMSLPAIWLCSVALLFPCVSLGVLVVVNSRATDALQKAGVRVGLMGATLSEVP